MSAHIIEGHSEECFSSLCYAGHLPGYTMGYNIHGLVFSVNTLTVAHLHVDGIPRHFVARALLNAPNLTTAQRTLRAYGAGVADGFSVNMSFLLQGE